jgi:hypothetical protein
LLIASFGEQEFKMKKVPAAVLVAVGLLATSTAASAQAFCVLPLMVSAAIVGAQEHRELTNKEAFFCGLIRDEDAGKKAAVTKKAGKKSKKKKVQ